MVRTCLTRAVAAALLIGTTTVGAGCEDQRSTPTDAASAPITPASATASSDAAAPLGRLVRPDRLSQGPPPRVDYLADGVLRHDGRSTTTDFPTDVAETEILGAVDGRVIVTGALTGVHGGEVGFFAVDASGRTRRLGEGPYQTYDYGPILVERTGHIWVHYDDRGDRGTWIWVIDARTGREIASYVNPARRRLLPPGDQEIYDAWTRGRGTTQPVDGTSPDGSLTVSTRSARVPHGALGQRVAVQRSTDQAIIARFTFVAAHSEGAVERAVFEDDHHLLVRFDFWPGSGFGAAQTVVRCDIPRGTCQRALPIRGQVALGILPWSVVS